MAILADVACLDVSGAPTGGSSAVVAADAVTDDAGVIEQCRQPRRRIVAVVALVTGRDMSRRLAGRLSAIVAADAVAGQGRVVHKRDHSPTRSNVTV